MAAAREGNIGSAVRAGPLLWAVNRPMNINHSRLRMLRSGAVSNLLPPVLQHSAAIRVRFPSLLLGRAASRQK